MRKVFIAATVAAATFASSLHAQGSLSSQGLGYPPGELSTRALGTAGAIADFDARSPINPATLAIRPAAQVYAQYDPEFRTVVTSTGTASTTTARMPNIGGILPINRHFVIGISASTLLDRTWQTGRARSQDFGNDTVAFNESLKSEGAITDVRFSAAYALTSKVRVGLGFHTFPGSMRLTSNEIFPDTTQYQNITQISEVSFSGDAVSAGFEADVLPSLSVAFSGQKGGTAKMFANDSLLTTATIPDRYSGSIAFSGIPGTVLSVRASHQSWSQLSGLSYAKTVAADANDVAFGLESAGPRLGGFPVLFRLGVRRRTLPFEVGTSQIQETSYGGGIGVPIAYDKVILDMAVLRSARTGFVGVDEHAYNLSFGLQVRP